MNRHKTLQRLFDFTERVGSDPLLTQASTGNSSAKLDGVLWVKASGKWMADANRDDIFIPLDLAGIDECLRRQIDPAERYSGASLETALHAALPHPIVLHVHCVNTITWAVRRDGRLQLERLLAGLRWQWIPYVPSGLPLAREVESSHCAHPDTNLFVLANHGLIVCGENTEAVESLLEEVRRRVAVKPREPHPADYAALWELSNDSAWDLPVDDELHALGTDAVSREILRGGLLYPCQAIFSGARMFRAIPYSEARDRQYSQRPFLIVEGRGVMVSRNITSPEVAMLSGLAQVVQRLGPAAPLRYLTASEIADIPSQVAHRYRELASARVSLSER